MRTLDILRELVAIRSVSGEEKEIGGYLGRFLEGNGFTVEYQEVEPGRNNILAKKGNPSILFFGHMDTVTPVENWGRDPFSLTIEEDRAYGLGTWDMKGGMAAILNVAQSAENMAILFTVDEEGISKGAWRALERKGFFDGIKGVISAEAGNEPGTYGGARHLSYGRQGRKAFRLVKELDAGHAATVESGWVDWLHSAVNSLPKTSSRIIIREFSATSKGLSLPDQAAMDIDVLIHPDDKDVDFSALLSEHFGAKAELVGRETKYLEPYSWKDHPFIAEVVKTMTETSGEPSMHIGSSPGDECALSSIGLPTAIIGPEGRNEHRAEEWVSVKSLEEIAAIYAALVD